MSKKLLPAKEIRENLKVASYSHDIATVYDRARKFIVDRRYLKRFDMIMGNLDYEEDAESFFEEVIEDYLAEEAEKKLGPRWGFGVHRFSGDIGFWEKNEHGSYELEYPGMIVRFDDESYEDEEPEEDEEQEEDKPGQEQQAKKEGIVEVLGENGEVLRTTKYRCG